MTDDKKPAPATEQTPPPAPPAPAEAAPTEPAPPQGGGGWRPDRSRSQIILFSGLILLGVIGIASTLALAAVERRYIDRVARHPHVLLMRTLSKFGLAGVRLGYMMGPQALIEQVDKVRPPYNISVLNCEAALFALEHAGTFADQAQDLRAQRTRLQQALARLPGVKSWPSDANMILVRVPDAGKVFEGLKARGVLVKNVSKMHPLLANCLRLTVGSADENTQLLAALEAAL